MISRTCLIAKIDDYIYDCSRSNRKPTHMGIGKILGISTQTVLNICKGNYADGKQYTAVPHATRCINNADFEYISSIFDGK